jgi:drug/metabolite transporter (DMT)-like permease
VNQKEVEKLAKAQDYKIYLLLIFVMAAWGLNVIATKIIVSHFMPVTITALRVFTAGVSAFIILFFLKKLRLPRKKEWKYIIAGSLFNVVAHHYFLSIGLSKTTASNGGLILGLGPLLTAIMAFVFLNNRVTLPKVIGIILGFIGVTFIVLRGHGGIGTISTGDLYVFIAILAQAISFVIIKKGSETLDPRLMTGYMMIIGSTILFIISRVQEPDGLKHLSNGSIGVWLIFLASAIIATAVGHIIYNYALGKVGVAESAVFINLNPFFSLVGAVIFLKETIALTQILGFLLILAGVLFGSGALEEFVRQRKFLKEASH